MVNASDDLYIFAAIVVCFFVIAALVKLVEKASVSSKVSSLANNSREMTTDEFFRMRNKSLGGRGRKHISTDMDYAGVYILMNTTKGMPYIGQSQQVLKRVNDHLTGHGNGNVYADFCYGDRFTIRTVALQGSGFDTLNSLERNMIAEYNAYKRGYNKTRGNRG